MNRRSLRAHPRQAGRVLKWLAGLVAGVALLLAIGVAAIWAPDRPLASLTARWAQAPSTFLNIDGVSVHLRDEGPRDDPQPIVLIHGTSDSLHTWEGWVKELSSTRRVIRFDLPGFGLTGPAADNDYTMTRYVRFMRALYDHLAIKHSVLGGNSLGGGIAWQTALAMPERVDALILVDAGGYPPTMVSQPVAFRLARNPMLAPVLTKVLTRGTIEASVRNVFGDPTKVTPELVDRFYEMALREGNRAALFERFRQTTWGEAVELAPRIAQPTLIIWGGKDGLIPPDHGQRFAKDIKHSELVLFPELGHVPQQEDPAATVVAVKRFLQAPKALPDAAKGAS